MEEKWLSVSSVAPFELSTFLKITEPYILKVTPIIWDEQDILLTQIDFSMTTKWLNFDLPVIWDCSDFSTLAALMVVG